MRFSVIIPLYNKADYIKQTVQSVLDQTFQDFEIIVVDDASTDNSFTVAQTIQSPKVKVLTKPNGGTATARNLGIKESIGEFCCFLDADDFWLPQFLENINTLIKAYPQAGMYGCAYHFLKNNKTYHPGWHGLRSDLEFQIIPDYFESVLYGEQVIIPSSSAIPKTVLQEIGTFNENIRYTEDQELWNRIAMHYPIAFCNKVSAIYRQDAVNMKTRRVPKREIEFAAYLQQDLDNGLVPKNKINAARQIIAANLVGVASLNLLAGDKKTARTFLDDPRTKYMPKRKAAWEKMMKLPSFLVRWMYKVRTKIQKQR